jgi:hypothetical protein
MQYCVLHSHANKLNDKQHPQQCDVQKREEDEINKMRSRKFCEDTTNCYQKNNTHHMDEYYHLCPKIENCDNHDKEHLFHFVHYCKNGLLCPDIMQPLHCLLNVHHFSASFIASKNNLLPKKEANQAATFVIKSDETSETIDSNHPQSNASNGILTNSDIGLVEHQTKQPTNNSEIPKVNCEAFDFNEDK